MLQQLKAFYRAHKNAWLLRTMYAAYTKTLHFCKNAVAAIRLLRWKFVKNEAGRPIRVCFLQQDPNCWNKSKALYDLMKQDARFAVSLLCVPDPYAADTGSTYRYFAENGYDAIDARVGDGPWSTMDSQGDWFDLQSLQPDYVFYQQPYDAYLPEIYRSHVVYRYAKLCMTIYGIALTKELLSCMEISFMRHVYRDYATTEDQQRFNTRKLPLSHLLGIRYSHYYGILGLTDFATQKQAAHPAWDFSKNPFRVIWTPRWTTDEKIGGSNFFRYKDFLPAYAEANPDVDILFRPHPMLFDNFVRTGKMTQQEADDYIHGRNTAPNTAMDNEKSYGSSFWHSSVLLTDVSAVLVEYFVTGKPIIFCETENCASTYLDSFQQILSVCYIAKNQEQVAMYLNQLKTGEDPLKDQRQEIIEKLFGSDPTSTPQRIIDDLVFDYNRQAH